MQHKFYYNSNGKNVIEVSHITSFLEYNSELSEFVELYPISLRPIDMNEFEMMSYWVIGQIISNKVAHKLINNLRASINNFSPEIAVQLGVDGLQKYIPSKVKCQTILNLAQFFTDGNFLNPDDKSSREIIKHYSNVVGIGPWTVKMLLIYGYGRLDVLAIEDLGVRQGIQVLYSTPSVPTIPEARKLTKGWGDLATLGSLLSWEVIKSQS